MKSEIVIKKTGEEQRRRRRRGLMKNSHRHHFCFCNHCQKNKRDEIDEKKRSNIVVVVNIAVPHISSKIETDLAVNLDTNGKNAIEVNLCWMIFTHRQLPIIINIIHLTILFHYSL